VASSAVTRCQDFLRLTVGMANGLYVALGRHLGTPKEGTPTAYIAAAAPSDRAHCALDADRRTVLVVVRTVASFRKQLSAVAA
jgi:hypothetical protein